jgi:hypothetical protein
MTVLGRSEIRHTDAAADLARGRRSWRRALVVAPCGAGARRSLRRTVVALACAALLSGAVGAAPAAAGTA